MADLLCPGGSSAGPNPTFSPRAVRPGVIRPRGTGPRLPGWLGLLVGLIVGWPLGTLWSRGAIFFASPRRPAVFQTALGEVEPGIPLTPWEGDLPSVWVEDLTWVEMARGQQSGYQTVLIPTGGTEQGGPHLPTGKHNSIIRFTAERIAQRHGRLLVAPILSYVPEQAHLRYPGTIDIPEEVFQQVVEAAADSFLLQGFRQVVLMGDSGGNQAALRSAADRLQQRWAGDGRKIVWLDQYYLGHGQTEWLQTQGFTLSQLGTHAGLADTAEFMAVQREGVRTSQLPALSSNWGYDGQPHLASAEIGQKLLEQKIQAALQQLQRDLPTQ